VWKTDIISISFGLSRNSAKIAQAIEPLVRRKWKQNQQVIKLDAAKEVIILAAAGNSGNREKMSYPASEERVFKIFATDATGFGSKISPPASLDGWCFSTLGSSIESIWPSSLRKRAAKERLDLSRGEKARENQEVELWTRMTGTSFATPIAAALVATLYQFYDTNDVYFDLEDVQRFKSVAAVSAMLLKFSRPPDIHNDRYHYLDPLATSRKGTNEWFKYHPSKRKSLQVFFAEQLNQAILSRGAS
jgi:hypothetical protein